MNTYDHRTLKTRLPVRSALFKQRTGGLVVRWVTTSEYPLLYVFFDSLPLHKLARTIAFVTVLCILFQYRTEVEMPSTAVDATIVAKHLATN